MPKRKVETESEDDAQFSDASSENKPKPKKKTTTKKAQLGSPRGTDSSKKKPEDRVKVSQPSAANSSNLPTRASRGDVQISSEGDKYIDLGKKKRATVRSFKDVPLLDIREFYNTGSEEKPGKKGISLTLEQWQVLKENSAVIDDLFTQLSREKK